MGDGRARPLLSLPLRSPVSLFPLSFGFLRHPLEAEQVDQAGAGSSF